MARYFDFSFTVEQDILNLWHPCASSLVWIVKLNCLRRGIFGNVVVDKFHIATIPCDHRKDCGGKSEAISIGKQAVKRAWEKNE